MSGSASAASKDEKIGLQEAGITDEVQELYSKGKSEEAERLLDKHNIRYTSTSDSKIEVINKEIETDDSEIGNDTLGGRRPKEECDFQLTVTHVGDDEWIAIGEADLSGNEGVARTSHFIDDALGITYDSSEWTSVDATRDNVYLTSTNTSIEFEEYPAEKGPTVSVENVKTGVQDTVDNTAVIQTYLTRIDTGNDDIPVYFNYEHNWANARTASIDGISYDIPFFSIESGISASTTWSAKLSAEPGEQVEHNSL